MDVIVGPLIHILIIMIELYMWVIIINVVLSWLVFFKVVNTSNRFVYMVGDFCHRLTEPLLYKIRNFLPNLGNLDIAPLVLILGMIFLKEFLIRFSMQMT